MLARKEALELLKKHVSNEKLVKHCIAVASIMERLAERLGEDKELWYLTGLLHDIDYEKTKENMEMHGVVAEEILKPYLPEEAIRAIKAHNELTGFEDTSLLSQALKASDAMSGLIVATALVMPDKRLESVSLESLKAKFKEKCFARGVKRENIMLCEEIGIPLDEFLEISLNALKEVASELGL